MNATNSNTLSSNTLDPKALSGLEAAVLGAITTVNDPEYPGVSIVDLGLLETVNVKPDGSVHVGLVPTFSGCPALEIIASDVELALRSVDGVGKVAVKWLLAPLWAPERLSESARSSLATDFTVAVQIGKSPPKCPLCGAPTVEESMFGPSRCRSINRCNSCSETVEVMRA